MPTTSPDNIYYADISTPSSDVNVSAAEATSVQKALDSRKIKSYVWANSGARVSQAGMTPGDEGFQSDTNTRYVYVQGGWIPNRIVIDQGALVPYSGGPAIATGTNLSTINFAAMPVASRVIFSVTGAVGNASGSDQTGSVQFIATAGTPNALTTETIDVRNGKWNSVPMTPWLDLPANISATVNFVTSSSASLIYRFTGNYSRTVL